MKEDDNIIYVLVNKENEGVLYFKKYNIKAKAYIGKNGFTTDKYEKDGKTPLGEFNLGIVMGIYPENEVEKSNEIIYKKITDKMYWVDDPESNYYNKLVKDISLKDWNSAEHLVDYKVQYEYLIEIKTNLKNIKGKGSAIFLHCSNGNNTDGCIAVDKEIMKKLIKHIDKNTKVVIKEG